MMADNEAMTAQGRSVEAPAFDDLAAAYDAAFTASALGRSLRAFTWARLDAALGSSRRVLEIGCGTGEDARRRAFERVANGLAARMRVWMALPAVHQRLDAAEARDLRHSRD